MGKGATLSEPYSSFHKEEGMYVAKCPEVGTVDQGETIEESASSSSHPSQQGRPD